MGFIPYSYDCGQPLPFEYMPVSAGDVAQGLCMALSDGKLTKSVTPNYIAMCDLKDAVGGTVAPVVRVTPEAVFAAPLADGAAAPALGALAGVSDDGMFIDPAAGTKNLQITGMTEDGGYLCRFVY